MKNVIFSIAKKEFLDSLRNYLVVALTLIFLITEIIISLLINEGEKVVDFMKGLVIFIAPVTGIALGYATIVGEVERGSMEALLSYPVKRDYVVVGKLIGLGSVIALSVLVGLGLSGLIVFIKTSYTDYGYYLFFIVASIFLVFVFLNIAIAFSSFVKTSTIALFSSFSVWLFFSTIWSFLILAIRKMVESENKIGYESIPEWVYSIETINPIKAYLSIGSSNTNAPSELTITISLLIWTVVPVIIAILLFRRREL